MPLVPGQNLGDRYHIVRLLGLGGMGAVYQAWDEELGVVVAVKVIRPAADAEPAAARRSRVTRDVRRSARASTVSRSSSRPTA